MFMKATDLNRALNYVDDAYLMEADTPDKEIKTMKTKKRAIRILIAAALISLLTVTAYAAELLPIHSLESGKTRYYKKYSDMNRVIAQVGLQLDAPEAFENGFQFQGVEVIETKGKDENGKQLLSFQQLDIYYKNQLGQELVLSAGPKLKELGETERASSIQRMVEGVAVNYRLDHYKFVPGDYKLSEAEEEWAKQPNNYVSYGSDTVQEQDIAFLCWTENDIYYYFYGRNGMNPEDLFAMAEEMIQR